MMIRRGILQAATLLFATFATAAATQAQETVLKVVVGARDNWQNAPAELGMQQGIFQKHGLKLELTFSQGSGETQQAVISGSVDIGIGIGMSGIMGAYAKGAPLRVIGTQPAGVGDVYWYVKGDSPVHALTELKGATIAYSTAGSSTQMMANELIRDKTLDARAVATGGPAATMTQVQSGQITVGWSLPPIGLEAAQRGELRILARSGDVASLRGALVRVIAANAKALSEKPDALKRFMAAYRETIAWMYEDPTATAAYAKIANVSPEIAKLVPKDYYPKETLDPDRLDGLDGAVAEAVKSKFIPRPLDPAEVKELFQIPYK